MKFNIRHLIILGLSIIMAVMICQDNIAERAYYHPEKPPIPLFDTIFISFPKYVVGFYIAFYFIYCLITLMAFAIRWLKNKIVSIIR